MVLAVSNHSNFEADNRNINPSGCGVEQPTRIINGKETAKGRYPWMASVLVRVEEGKYASCGGSLINDRYILTAAHCLSQANSSSDVLITLFAHTSEDRIKLPKVAVDSLIKNPFWGKPGYGNHHDFSLIRLKDRQSFSASFSPICLPTKNTSWLQELRIKRVPESRNATMHDDDDLLIASNVTSGNVTSDPAVGSQTIPSEPRSGIRDSAFVTGWGHQSSLFGFKVKARALYEAATQILQEDKCENAWKDQYDEEYEICAGTAACQGDSGGPLAVRVNGSVTQIGVVSYGPRTCNIGFFIGPTVYERISAHLDFIHENTKDAIWCSP